MRRILPLPQLLVQLYSVLLSEKRQGPTTQMRCIVCFTDNFSVPSCKCSWDSLNTCIASLMYKFPERGEAKKMCQDFNLNCAEGLCWYCGGQEGIPECNALHCSVLTFKGVKSICAGQPISVKEKSRNQVQSKWPQVSYTSPQWFHLNFHFHYDTVKICESCAKFSW